MVNRVSIVMVMKVDKVEVGHSQFWRAIFVVPADRFTDRGIPVMKAPF